MELVAAHLLLRGAKRIDALQSKRLLITGLEVRFLHGACLIINDLSTDSLERLFAFLATFIEFRGYAIPGLSLPCRSIRLWLLLGHAFATSLS